MSQSSLSMRAAGGLALVAALGIAGCGSSSTTTTRATRTRATSTTSGTAAATTRSALASLGPLSSPGTPGPLGPEGVPIPAVPALASPGSSASGGPIDGIQCLGAEQTVFHIHAHLTIFLGGAARQVPAGIGITHPQSQSTQAGPVVARGGCFYWLHTHAADGILHIESPVQRTFTLGNLFDVWGQRLSTSRVGPASGKVTAIYNGEPYPGDPRNIPLTAHAQIQIEVGSPLVAPVTISFPLGV